MRGESHTHCDSGMLVSLVSMWVHPPLVTPPHVFKGGVTPRPPTPSDNGVLQLGFTTAVRKLEAALAPDAS